MNQGGIAFSDFMIAITQSDCRNHLVFTSGKQPEHVKCLFARVRLSHDFSRAQYQSIRSEQNLSFFQLTMKAV